MLRRILLLLLVLLAVSQASVFLPGAQKTRHDGVALVPHSFQNDLRSTNRGRLVAMAIPGNGVAEQVFVGGFANFLSIYNLVVTGRILLSWFPQAQGVAALQPVYAITDPFLNLFRGVIPPLFGLDLSPIAAFFLLNLVTNATAAVGCRLENGRKLCRKNPHFRVRYRKQQPAKTPSLNL